uniref:Uncharacterized protein n=1 Tax=Theileria sp. CAAS-2005 TaxID=346098 RepID=Q3LRT5_9APIC|nr:unknown protein [Theileria sp. CAAS-2005]
MNHDFLGLDLTKLAPYNHLGSSVISVGSRVDIMVRQERDWALNGFHKYTHEYHKISGSPSHFYLLDLKGADIPLIRGRLLKVEAFMATQQLNPLMVILHADEGIKYYLWKNGRFVEMNKTVMDALEERLRVAAFERFGTTFIDLNATSSYGYKSGEIDCKVHVEQLLECGAKTRKFIHTFKPTTDIRLTTHTSYFNLGLYPKGPRYNRLIVLKNDLGFPVLLTLLDTENKYHYYRYSGEGKWGRLEQGVEAAKVNLRGDEALLKDPVFMREVPNAPGLRPRVYNTTMYP